MFVKISWLVFDCELFSSNAFLSVFCDNLRDNSTDCFLILSKLSKGFTKSFANEIKGDAIVINIEKTISIASIFFFIICPLK